MNKFAAALLSICFALTLAGCGKQDPQPQASEQMPTENVEAPIVKTEPAEAAEAPAEQPATPTPAETISETEDEPASDQGTTSSVQPSLKVGAAPSGPPTSARFKEGTHYHKIVPAQPTNVAPGKVEVAEVFWYGCAHCYSLDPALESWRNKGPNYVEFVRVPAMWNDTTRMHARLFYTAELLGKLETLHPLIFREIHVNGNTLNSIDKISAFFKQHGVGADEFQKAFSSFAVESKLQRADFLNRRYKVQAVPLMIVNGKYSTAPSDTGGEAGLFALLNELVAHEHGG